MESVLHVVCKRQAEAPLPWELSRLSGGRQRGLEGKGGSGGETEAEGRRQDRSSLGGQRWR